MKALLYIQFHTHYKILNCSVSLKTTLSTKAGFWLHKHRDVQGKQILQLAYQKSTGKISLLDWPLLPCWTMGPGTRDRAGP